MTQTIYGENLTYTDNVTTYTGDEIKLNHGLNQQMSGALSALAPGVRSGWIATAGTGLTVNVAAGEGIVSHSTYGAVALRSTGTIASAAIPASSVGYIHALAENDGSPGGNRSVETMVPKFVYSDLNVLANATCIAYVVTGASSVTAVYDRRRIINPDGDGFAGMFAQDDASTDGLTVAFVGGRLTQADGTVIDVSPFTVTVASGDSYVDIDEDGTAYVRTSDTPVAGHKCIWYATANSTQVVTATKDRDRRTGFDFGAGGGGGTTYTAGDGIDITADVISIPDDGVTDDMIGERTVDQALATPGNTGTLTEIDSWQAGRLKAITGETNWYDAPDITLAATKTHVDAAAPHSGHFDVDGSKALTGDMNAGGFPIQNLGIGTGPDRAVTGDEFDSLVVSGTAPLPFAWAMKDTNATLSGLQTFDGSVSMTDGKIGFLNSQSSATQNGPWIIRAGAWERPTWFDTGDTPDVGARIFIKNGDNHAGETWALLTSGAVIGTDPLEWTQVGAGGNGEANTASNVGAGAGLTFKGKAGLDLQLRTHGAADAWTTVVTDGDIVKHGTTLASIDRNALGGGAATVPNGGTNKTGIAKGSMLYASATDTYAEVAANGTGTPKFLQQTSDGAPTWAVPAVPGYITTSTTSRAMGTGSLTWTVADSGLGYKPRDWVRIEVSSDGTKYMLGQVTSYSGVTLTVNITKVVGSGTYSGWNFNLSAEPGANGTNGAGFAAPVTLTDGGTINVNTDSGQRFHVEGMAGDRTFAFSGTPEDMARLFIRITPDSTDRTPAWPTTGDNKVLFDRVDDPGAIEGDSQRLYVFMYDLPQTGWQFLGAV